MADAAAGAVGLSCVAHGPAVEHDAVAEIRGVLRRQDFAQGHLDLYRVLQVIHQTQAVGNAYAMGVHHGGAGDVEHVAQDEIGGRAPCGGQARQELLAVRCRDDGLHQSRVRQEVRQQLIWPNQWPDGKLTDDQTARAETMITEKMENEGTPLLGKRPEQYRYRLPWHRTFEVAVKSKEGRAGRREPDER